MKLLITGAAMAAVLLLSSCRKEQEYASVSKQVDISLAINQSFTYTIPVKSSTADMPVITSQALHYSTSNLKIDNISSQVQLAYTPEKDFVGTDAIVVSPARDKREGNCRQPSDTTYKFMITVAKTK